MIAVFATCVGYDTEAVRPFVETLRKSTGASLYIFHANLSEATISYLRGHAVQLRPWTDEPTWEACVIRRYGHYLRLIQSEEMRFDRAMFSDIRDVIFQADPFASPTPYRIKSFAEEVTFCESEVNQRWLRRCYGDEVVSQFADKPVLCAGVTLASYVGAVDYLSQMSQACEAMPERFFGVDQAVHNYLVSSGALGDVEIVPNRAGEVQTMALQEKFVLDGQGRVLNDDGNVCPTLHQYDRHPLFGAYLLESMGFRAITADGAAIKLKEMERLLNSRSRLTKRWLRVMVGGRTLI